MSYDEHKINISPDFHEFTDEQETTLHEVNHALYWYFFKGKEQPPTEEEYIECMSKGLMMVLRDNPKLKDYLFQWLH